MSVISIKDRSRVDEPIVAACSCGRQFTATEWKKLPRVGKQSDFNGGYLELRNCHCASTQSVPVVPLGKPMEVIPASTARRVLELVLAAVLGAGALAALFIILFGVIL